jgi:NADH-quinone oxidoreductase subunit M
MNAFLQSIGYANWVLPVMLAIPLMGAGFLWFHGFVAERALKTGPASDDIARWVTFGTFTALFVVSAGLWWAFDPHGGWQFTFSVPWLPRWGVTFSLAVDGISIFLVLLTSFLMPIAVLSGWTSIDKRVHTYHALFLVLTTAMLGVFMARDTFLFYVMWEIVLVPMFFIIGVWGGERRMYAATKFFIYTFIGSLLMLLGILYLGIAASDPVTGRPDFAYDAAFRIAQTLSSTERMWLFVAFFAAFAVKIPLFPFHTWLPDAHVEAPTEGSVDLAAILLKMGTYGLLRFSLPLFPDVVANPTVRSIVLGLAVVGVIYGALVALVQTDFKRLVAYSSVSHMGLVVLGIFALTAESMQGAMMVQISHGLSTGALFLMIGMLYDRRHTRVFSAFGGLARVMPLYGLFLMICVMSSIAVPGTNGFIGEFLVLAGSFQTFPVLAVISAVSVVLSAIFVLWALQRVIFNPLDKPENLKIPDMNWREVAMMVPVAAIIFYIGLHPAPLLRRMEPRLQELVQQIQPHVAAAAAARASSAAAAVAVTADSVRIPLR